jgi:RNA:NAD 2'-phosphotransferase (TPT1/KptA family)
MLSYNDFKLILENETGLPLNPDKTVTVYHHTSKENSDKIKKTGKLISKGEPHVYVTTRKEPDTGYGEVAVPIRINPRHLQIDDEFPNGRKDYSIYVGSKKHINIKHGEY